MPNAELVSHAPIHVRAPDARWADDPLARCLLRRAQGALQKWPEGFPGFRASARGQTARGTADAEVAVNAHGAVELHCDDAGLRTQLHEMLRRLVAQRTPRFFDDGDGRFSIAFADANANASERAVEVHVRSGRLTYWIDGRGRVRREERAGDGLRVLTSFEEHCRTTPGRVLPVKISIATWDLTSGALLGTEIIHDSHRRLDHVWLPLSRQISGPGGGDPSLRVTLDDHQLL